MATNPPVTTDTQALLLLLSRLGQPKGAFTPLSLKDYDRLALWLQAQGLRPGDLLTPTGREPLQSAPRGIDAGRIEGLIARKAALGFAVEDWTSRGLWVIGRGDADYPKRLKQKLRRDAPPLLFGVGPRAGLQARGVAVVGSRAADASALEFTRTFARRCVEAGLEVISGAARGVDSEAMLGALKDKGHALGVLPGDLERTALEPRFRKWIEEERLTLVSPFDPKARFTVGSAMDRNKVIYALGEFSVVVSSDFEKGGTWAGAIENMTARWVPLFVRQEIGSLEGNARLIERGGIAVTPQALGAGKNLGEWLTQQAQTYWKSLAESTGSPQQVNLPV